MIIYVHKGDMKINFLTVASILLLWNKISVYLKPEHFVTLNFAPIPILWSLLYASFFIFFGLINP